MVMLELCGACKNYLFLIFIDMIFVLDVEFMIKVGKKDQFLVKFVIWIMKDVNENLMLNNMKTNIQVCRYCKTIKEHMFQLRLILERKI
jgi:hypothetical protein